MTDRFAICLPRILIHEGGWSDDPEDPGGATMKGVTLAVFRAFKERAVTKAELRRISDADLAEIYRRNYWNVVRADELPAGVDYVTFDIAVNSGPGRAARILQAAAGANMDGAIGPATLEAVRRVAPEILIRAMGSRREAFYRSLPTFPRFGRGWLARCAQVTATALGDLR